MTSKPKKENPMSCYKHFTTKERESLLVLLKKGQKNTEIAKELGRSPSSISREIRRNAAPREDYSAIRAEEQYRERRKRCVRHYKLSEPDYARKVSELIHDSWPTEKRGKQKDDRALGRRYRTRRKMERLHRNAGRTGEPVRRTVQDPGPNGCVLHRSQYPGIWKDPKVQTPQFYSRSWQRIFTAQRTFG